MTKRPRLKQANKSLGAILVEGRFYHYCRAGVTKIGRFIRRLSNGAIMFQEKGRGKTSVLPVDKKTTFRQ